MEEALSKIIDACTGLPSGFKEFLAKQAILTVEALGMAATTEAEVKTELIDMALAAQVKIDVIGEKVAIKKLWKSCRETMEKKKSNGTTGAEQDEPLPEDTEIDIKMMWKSLHGIVLPEAWLLIPTLQGKLWRGACKSPPCLDILLLEKLRPLSQIDLPVGSALNCVPGKYVETTAVIVDNVHNVMEVYTRLRAYFMTMAYVNIRNTSFFDFQCAIFASEKIHHLVTQTYGRGAQPPASFFATAWAGTNHYLAEQVRVSGKTLTEAITNTGGWEHKWSGWTPPVGASQPAGAHTPDLPKHIAEEMRQLRDSARMWQQTADRYKDVAAKAQELVHHPGRHGGKNDNGKGSDKRAHDGKGKGNNNKDKRPRYYDDRSGGSRDSWRDGHGKGARGR